jgi:hypothetical protein
MPTHKSKVAEIRHGPRFQKQLDGLHLMEALAAAREAVVKAAMAWWHEGWQGVEYKPLADACDALAKLEGAK